jgi:hypothetical protein
VEDGGQTEGKKWGRKKIDMNSFSKNEPLDFPSLRRA